MMIANLWTLRIEHDYYREGESGDFNIHLSSEMRRLLMRRNLVVRRSKPDEWCLSSFGNAEVEVDADDVLELELVAQGSELQYVTDFAWPVEMNCYDVEIPVESSKIPAKECTSKKGRTRTQYCIMKLQIPLGKMVNSRSTPVTTTLLFQPVCKYWEYIFIPRQNQQEKTIRLEDTRKTIGFGEVEQVDFVGHNAFKIRSLEKVPLRNLCENIELVLWELFPSRDTKRVLLQKLPFPEPSLCLGFTPDTAWRILYF